MSDLPVSEENQFDDNLLRSIEVLLDENEQNSFLASSCDVSASNSNIQNNQKQAAIPMPHFQQMNDNTFAFGNQVYQKWSNNESSEMQNNGGIQKYNSQRPKENYAKSFKKNAATSMVPPLQQMNPHLLRYQAMLTEKANRLLHQYLQLNYEFLSAQAAILGIPLEQYIRNLLIATTNQSVFMSYQLQQAIPNIVPRNAGSPIQNLHQTKQFNKMPFNKMPFNKKN